MQRRSLVRRSVALAAVLALAAPAAANARGMYIADDRGALHRVDSQFPGILLDSKAITGMAPGAEVVGMDFRAFPRDLIAVGSDSAVYSIDPDTAATTRIGTSFSPGLVGTAFGVDVNPVADALRVTGDTGINYRLAFATGSHAPASPDAPLNPGTPSIVGSAYTNAAVTPRFPAARTSLYGVDASTDQLFVKDPPNAGTLRDPKPLGVDIGLDTGFDIAGDIGYMAATPAGARGASLYRVDLGAGAATRLGPIGTDSLLARKGVPRMTVKGLAAYQGWPANIPPAVAIAPTTLSPKPRQRAAYVAAGMDIDGTVVKTEWDTDGDGRYDDATGRVAYVVGEPWGPADCMAVRVTDDRGATAVAELKP